MSYPPSPQQFNYNDDGSGGYGCAIIAIVGAITILYWMLT